MRFIICLAALLAACAGARAAETIKVAIGSGGNLEAYIAEIGARGGFFEKQGLTPDVFYTAGSGETLQAVLSNSAPIGIAIGSVGVFGAYAKGAPLRMIGSSSVGSPNYWYVKTDSPIRKLEDIAGHTIAYSTAGSGTQTVALLVRGKGIDAKLVATGNTPGTFTQVMTGQVDVGFAYPEFGQDALADGRIRLIFRDNDFPRMQGQTIRSIVMQKSLGDDVGQRFMRAYLDSVNWIYGDDPKPMQIYGELIKIDAASARKLRDGFWPRTLFDVAKVRGIDILMEDAIAGKFIQKALTQAEIEDLVAPYAR